MADFASEKYQSDLELVRKIGKAADSVSMARFLAQDLVIETKPDATPVTDADKAVENAFRKLIAEKRPDDLVVGEEFGSPDSLAGKYYWVIDPIDGTKNFLRGVPTWATLIALMNEKGESVVGVVSAPALNRTWFAKIGSGAFVQFNGIERKISNPTPKHPSDYWRFRHQLKKRRVSPFSTMHFGHLRSD